MSAAVRLPARASFGVGEVGSGEIDFGKVAKTPRKNVRKANNGNLESAPGGIDRLEGMGFEQYHEPASELSQETRTRARILASLTEEAEAIGWYEQRLSLERDPEAKAVMENAQHEEFKHFGMDLEFLLRRMPRWRETPQGILFPPGDIVKHGEQAEESS
jgi:uncharacterized protein